MKKFIHGALLISLAFGAGFPLKISDSNQQEVTITQEPQRIVVAGGLWPMPSVIAALGGADKLVYMPTAGANAIRHSFLVEIFPQLQKIQHGNTENIEELLLLKPDLFICHSSNKKVCEAMKASKIPTLAISVSNQKYNSKETLREWLNIVAPVLNATQKANDIIQETTRIEQDIANKLDSKKQPPTAIIIHRVDENGLIGIGGIFADYLLPITGAKNLATSTRPQNISIEELYTLNPDIIYINNFNRLIPQDLFNNPKWKYLKAIKDKRVYKFPLGSYRPFAPSVDLPVLLLWLYQHNYNIKDINIKQYAKEYYHKFLGLELTETQIKNIFIPNKNAGKID